MPAPSTFNPTVILDSLTIDRLRSYLEDCDNDLDRALNLYAWNAQVAAAFLEDLGRLEVVLRNRFDKALTALVTSSGHASHWFDQPALFPGRHGEHALDDIAKAKFRATKNGRSPVARNKIIAELSFGFWRYLCAERYLTSLWVPHWPRSFRIIPPPKTRSRYGLTSTFEWHDSTS